MLQSEPERAPGLSLSTLGARSPSQEVVRSERTSAPWTSTPSARRRVGLGGLATTWRHLAGCCAMASSVICLGSSTPSKPGGATGNSTRRNGPRCAGRSARPRQRFSTQATRPLARSGSTWRRCLLIWRSSFAVAAAAQRATSPMTSAIIASSSGFWGEETLMCSTQRWLTKRICSFFRGMPPQLQHHGRPKFLQLPMPKLLLRAPMLSLVAPRLAVRKPAQWKALTTEMDCSDGELMRVRGSRPPLRQQKSCCRAKATMMPKLLIRQTTSPMAHGSTTGASPFIKSVLA
mmetsp:Transcript_16102/g.34100  ORF Transcript_16102/g.34100 Transcript_16102/m.34100 type:complete len:290 (-) Transcript_16102:251-1120(-)